MANKKINALDLKSLVSLTDLMIVGDPATGTSYKTTLQSLSNIISSAGVTSFNGRTGAVVPTSSDYSISLLSDVLITSLNNNQILLYDSVASKWTNVALTTTNVTEGTNLYYTDARARQSISLTTTGTSGAATYNSTTGVLNIPQYLSGSGTVTSVSVVTANGLAGTVANQTTTPAITLKTTVNGLLKGNSTTGEITAAVAGTDYLTANQNINITGDATGSGTTNISLTLATVNSNIGTFNNVTVNAKGLVTAASNVSYLTGNQSITLSGDVSGTGTTSITTAIGNNKVTNSMLATVPNGTFHGRVSAGIGNIENLTGTQATTLLDLFTSTLKGLVPASGGGTTNFLRADGTWASPSGTGTVTSVSVVTANGFTGSVANSTTTPAITISTTINGLIKGNGTSLSAAIANTDYQSPITLTTTGTSGAATFNGTTLNIPNYGASAGMPNPMTTLGDIIYGDTGGTPTRLAGNTTTAKQFLSQTGNGTISSAPSWSSLSNSDIPGAALTKTDDTNVTLTLGGTPSTSLLRATSLTLGWTGTLSTTRGGTGLSAIGTSLQLLRVNSGGTALEYFTPNYLTANQSITLSGAVTGTGTTSITTTLSNNVVGISNLTATGTPSASTYLRGDNTWATISTSVVDGDKGDITVSGSGATWTIDSQAVSYSKIQNASANTFLANATGTASTLQEISTARIPLFSTAITGTPSATTYLRGDGSWSTVGTVTSISVVSANGFAGTVATATTTPAITISTTVTGILKGNGTSISAAVANTDYQSPITLTTTGTSGAATFNGTTLNIPQYNTGMTNPMTTLGDVIYGGTSGTPTRLAGNISATKQFLSQTGNGTASAAPSWSTVTKSDVGLGNVENTALSTWAGSTNITTLGTIATGTWDATTIAVNRGGTGATTLTGVVIGNGTSAMTAVSSTTALQILRVNATGNGYEFATLSTGGITSLNGLTAATQTFSNDTNVTITSASTTHTIGWSGTLSVSRGGTGLGTLGTANQLIRVNAGATALEYFTPSYITANQTITLSGDASGSGSTSIAVTNTGLRGVALPTLTASAGFLRYTGTGTNTWVFDTATYLTTAVTTISFGTTGLTPSTATSGAITVAGTLVVANGGTGATTLTGILVGNGTSAVTAVTGTASQLLRRNAGNNAYEFFTPSYLTTAITSLGGQTGATQTFANDTNVTISSSTNTHTLGWTGTLSVGRGGTGASTLTGVLIGNGTSAVTSISSTTALQVFRVNAAGNGYEFATVSTGGITTLNTLTAATQTFATGTSGNDFNISSATSTHTFNIPSASASARGLVTTTAQTFAGNKLFQDNISSGQAIPAVLAANNRHVFIGQAGNIQASNTGNDIYVFNNAYFNGTNIIAKNTGTSGYLGFDSNNNLVLNYAASVAAGATATYTQLLKVVGSTGNLLINTNTDNGFKLQVAGNTSIKWDSNSVDALKIESVVGGFATSAFYNTSNATNAGYSLRFYNDLNITGQIFTTSSTYTDMGTSFCIDALNTAPLALISRNQYIDFRIGNFLPAGSKMRLFNSGYLGIGSTTDDGVNALQVTGSAKVTSQLKLTSYNTSTSWSGTPTASLAVDASGNVLTTALSSGTSTYPFNAIQKSLSLELPTATDQVGIWYVPTEMLPTEGNGYVLTGVTYYVRGTSPSVSFNIKYSGTRTGTTTTMATVTGGTSTAGTTITPSISGYGTGYFWLEMTAVSGTVTELFIQLNFKGF